MPLCCWSFPFTTRRIFKIIMLVDAAHCALNAMGFKDVEIVVAETGWPYRGYPNEVGLSVENANDYNGNLSKM
ncbi:hypothetical protein Patl1_23562 [Pistacia atlantica]|uniref:Uncharacterized protein n=1 Tax=Pistacia atlantica TaxID=434234 RepID=A0ACC0ZXB7_9ROSI|nr:hypothetical protein Patl1_23562 [Pistacia atlantica]